MVATFTQTDESKRKYEILAPYFENARYCYMVKVYSSRTNSTRGYRLFTIDGNNIRDVTAAVCRAFRAPWDRVRGTIELRESYEFQDVGWVKDRLPNGLGRPIAVILL